MGAQRGAVVRRAPSLAGKLAADDDEGGTKPAAPQPSWGALAQAHAGQYAAVAALLILLALSERWDPFRHALYAGPTSDLEVWRYSYPLRPNHVPAWAVPCVSLLTPLAVVLGFHAAGRIGRVEAHHACLMAVACVATAGLLTNWIKVNVGRPRPHFVHRCWPGGAKPIYTADGLPKCADNALDVAEGTKSFPSGHTSWSTSGLGYLTFWLLGKLACFDGQPQPTRFLVSLLPLLGAVWIGMSRVQDYWHHVEDVAAGFVLGLLMAWAFYRQLYAGVTGPHAGVLMTAAREANGKSSLTASPSRFSLFADGEEAAHSGDERV